MAERQVTIRVKADGSNVVQTFRLMGKEGERALGQVRSAANSQGQALTSLGRDMDRTRSRGAALGGGMRNTALQLSQVGQQTIATGNFVQALAIQLPDLALGFGTLGIALGVVAGVALPVVANALFDTSDKGGDLEDQLSKLDAETKKYQASVDRLRSPMADMREEFSENAVAARRLFDVQRQQAQINIFAGLAATRRQLAEQVGADSGFDPEDFRNAGVAVAFLTERLQELRDGAQPIGADEGLRLQQSINDMGRLSEVIIQVSHDLGVSNEEAGDLLASFSEFNNAEGPQQQADAVSSLRDLYFAAASANGELSDEQNETLNTLHDLELKLLEVIAGTDQVTQNTGEGARNIREMADEMSRAASEAVRFVSNLGTRSLAGVRAEVAALEGGGSRVEGQVARREADIRSSDEFQAAINGPEGLRREAIEGLQRELDLTREAAQLDERRADALRDLNETRVGGGSGGGGGGGAPQSLQQLNAAARQTESIIKQAQQAAVGYSDIVGMLDQALQSGKISQEEYNRALELARDRFEKVGEGASRANEEFGRLVAGVTVGGRSISDTLSQLGSQLISSGIGGLGGPLLEGLGLDGLFAGFFDGGGFIPRGQFGIAGENGPEIVPGPARVISRADTARIMGGGDGGGGRVEVVARVEGGNITQHVREVSGDVAARVVGEAMTRFERDTLPVSVERINRDPRRRG